DGSNPRIRTPAAPSARGETGRRGTFRPCRSGFESPRADHPSVAELAYAAVSNTAQRIGPESRAHVGSNPTAGTILRGHGEERASGGPSAPLMRRSHRPREFESLPLLHSAEGILSDRGWSRKPVDRVRLPGPPPSCGAPSFRLSRSSLLRASPFRDGGRGGTPPL